MFARRQKMNELLKSFSNYICSCCKAECEKGIVLTPNGARCVDYVKDAKKIEKYKKLLVTTARRCSNH